MSGGSYDYVSYKIDEAAGTLRSRHPRQPHVVALAVFLEELAPLMHDIEWADSCDTEWDDALDAKIKAFVGRGREVAVATDDARQALAALQAVLESPGSRP